MELIAWIVAGILLGALILLIGGGLERIFRVDEEIPPERIEQINRSLKREGLKPYDVWEKGKVKK